MYKYHNENPNGYHIPDCVIRAITTATGMSYYDVICKLKLNGNTAREVASDFIDDIVILRMEGHLSVSVCGVIHDIWDCSDEIVTDFWIV